MRRRRPAEEKPAEPETAEEAPAAEEKPAEPEAPAGEKPAEPARQRKLRPSEEKAAEPAPAEAEKEPEPSEPEVDAFFAEPDETEAKPNLLSPVVRKLIRENEVDVSQLTGTGDGGRITRKDVEAYLASGPPAAAEAPAEPAPAPEPAPTPDRLQPPPSRRLQRRATRERRRSSSTGSGCAPPRT